MKREKNKETKKINYTQKILEDVRRSIKSENPEKYVKGFVAKQGVKHAYSLASDYAKIERDRILEVGDKGVSKFWIQIQAILGRDYKKELKSPNEKDGQISLR